MHLDLIRLANFCKRITRSKNPFRELVLKVYLLLPKTCHRFYFSCRYYKMFLSTGSIAQFRYAYGHDFVDDEETLLISLAGEGGLCIDVGANVGTITLALALERNCRVVSIEANKKSYLALVKNIKLNKVQESVCVFNVAATKIDNEPLYIEDNQNYDTCNRIVQLTSPNTNFLDPTAHSNRFMTVNGRSIDSIDQELQLHGVIDLLKIDIEGHELKALEGASNVLSKTRIIYFEYWDVLASNYGYNLKDILIFLQGHGFNIITCPAVMGDNLDWTDCFSVTIETSGQKLDYYIAVNTRLNEF